MAFFTATALIKHYSRTTTPALGKWCSGVVRTVKISTLEPIVKIVLPSSMTTGRVLNAKPIKLRNVPLRCLSAPPKRVCANCI